MASIWSEGAEISRFGALKGNIKADVLVIGGGMAGLLCAYMLTSAGADCVLAEAGRVCSGVTRNTTAKITAQHGLIYQKLLKEFGAEKARLYYEANSAAIEKYAGLCRNIDCGFERKDAFVYDISGMRALEKELAALNKIGAAADIVSRLPLPLPTAGAVRFKDQAQFDPLRFAAAISQGLRIYENTAVREIRDGTALTGSGSIKAGSIIVATHFPFINKHGSYFLKLHQERAYVIALENAQDVGGMYIDGAEGGLSFRNYGGLLLLGGNSHRTGRDRGAWEPLESFARAHYPASRTVCRWAAQDCMTLDGMPYIGSYSRRTHALYVATGFNKWGMSGSMTAAMVLTAMLTGKGDPYGGLFSPSRSVLRPQLAANAAAAVVSLLTPSAPRCPHMGCALKWNRHEHSWDCPCHGSRFSKDGELLENPSTGSLDPKQKTGG